MSSPVKSLGLNSSLMRFLVVAPSSAGGGSWSPSRCSFRRFGTPPPATRPISPQGVPRGAHPRRRAHRARRRPSDPCPSHPRSRAAFLGVALFQLVATALFTDFAGIAEPASSRSSPSAPRSRSSSSAPRSGSSPPCGVHPLILGPSLTSHAVRRVASLLGPLSRHTPFGVSLHSWARRCRRLRPCIPARRRLRSS